MTAARTIVSPLVVHIVRRLAVGGMENGLVNLINHMPGNRYRHAIVCLTEATDFKDRIDNKAIPVIELKQTNGHDPRIHLRVWKTLRALGPDIIHTRNLPTLEFQLAAALAGVRGRIHGEHGRDMYDLDGKNFKYNLLRKALRPFVGRYIAVSRDLEQWLLATVGVKRERITQIYNGVDTEKFKPRGSRRDFPGPEGWLKANSFLVGTAGPHGGGKRSDHACARVHSSCPIQPRRAGKSPFGHCRRRRPSTTRIGVASERRLARRRMAAGGKN